MKQYAFLAITAALGVGSWIQGAEAQQRPPGGEVEIVPVRQNFYMLAGAGANIGVLVGPDGFIVVDTGAATMTDKVLQALDTLADGTR